MSLWWAVGLILFGVVLDRWLPRVMRQADEERRPAQLRPFGPAPSNIRLLRPPALYDQEADGG